MAPALPPMNPVLARELKQRMRGRHTWMVLTLYLTVLALILRWVYLAASRTSPFGGGGLLGTAGVGRAVFQWLLFFMLALVCFIVPGLTAAAISGERERQTLISLQITLLRARSIVLGKLLASLAFVALLLVAGLPLVTIPFLVGGVSVAEVIRGVVMVLATSVILACLSVACSAVLRRTQGATVVAYGLTLALVLGTLAVYGAQQFPRNPGEARPRPWILALNPFAATADVVQGRNPSAGFDSPFGPLVSLLRLSDNGRISQVFDGQPQFGGAGVVVSGRGPGEVIEVRPAVPATISPPGVSADGPGPPIGMVGQATGPERTRLAGIPFWLVSLLAWSLMGTLALGVAARRISLPSVRESR